MSDQAIPGQSGWIGSASTRMIPPASYWAHLTRSFPGAPVAALMKLSDLRVNEFKVSDLPPSAGKSLLEAIAADGWVQKESRTACPNGQCDYELTDVEITSGHCPNCDAVVSAELAQTTVYVRSLAPTRDVDWVVVIHGMNTKGEWQEEFSWFFGTTWGRSIPVFIFKYGIIIAGVILFWKRRKFQRDLRSKLAELRTQARSQGFGETPDVIAHSFGTWLIGHLLLDELKNGVEDPLHFGRIILTGCVLRPDFDWNGVKAKGLVKEVLNHYATKDPIVPFAHWTIWDSGPSGLRGFDSKEVINIRAVGLKHSDLFSVDLCVKDGRWRQPCSEGATRGNRHLDHTYETYWRPFLTLPASELDTLPNISLPVGAWKQALFPFRGTLFPVVVIPLIAALAVLLIGWIGGFASQIYEPAAWIVGCGSLGLFALVFGITATLLWRVILSSRNRSTAK